MTKLKTQRPQVKKVIFLLAATFLLSSCILPYQKLSLDQKIAVSDITNHKTIPEIQELIKREELTSEQLTIFYIDKIISQNARYNAVITINPNAISQARKLDKEIKAGKYRGLLHGIPILVKDNIETAEMPTTAGALVLADNDTGRDAPLIANLKAQGAIILGKTNLSEWANFRSTRSSSGWSAVGGQTKNPNDPTRSTCGSSSGSSAAVIANFAVAAIGTETDGSIVCPSSATGIVGIKPTVGLVSRRLIIPISHSQDTAGPMTKSVTDAAIVLAAMQGQESLDSGNQDPAATHYSFDFTQNYQASLSPIGLNGKNIGILHSPAMNHESVKALFDNFVSLLKREGASLNDSIKTEPYDEMYDDELSVLMYEFKHGLNGYLQSLPNKNNQLTLKKIISFNQDNADKSMPFFQQEIFEMSQEKDSLKNPDYNETLARLQKATREDGLDKLFKENKLDVILSVTLGPAWKIDKINGDHYTGGISSYSAISGYPHITIPLGKVHGLPIGLSLMGLGATESQLIQYAYTLEQLIKETESHN